MPEHDIDDLDAAFARLENSIAGSTQARGAGAAIATARRRRRTKVGAVAAAAVLVVGGVALAQGVTTHDNAIAPAGLPSPAPFDASALNAATEGWQTDWHSPTKPDEISLQGSAAPRCLESMAADFDKPATPGPEGAGGGVLVSRGGAASLTTLAEWGADHPDASSVGYAAVAASIDSCAQASPDREYTWDGAVGRSWTISVNDQASQHLWVARTDSAIGVVWAGGSAGPVPDEVDQRVTSALVAGLLSPKSFTPTQPDNQSASGSSSVPSFQAVPEKKLKDVFGTWPSGLTTGGAADSDMPSTPCTPDSFDSSSGGGGASIGSTGVQNYFAFDSTGAAADGLQEAARQWQDCPETDYTVTNVDVPGRGTVTVSTSTGPKAATNWAVQDGPYLLVLSISGGSNPPEQVSVGVGGLLYEVVTSPQQEGPGSIAPKKLKALQREGQPPVASSSAVAKPTR
jgi:hypothetical protein